MTAALPAYVVVSLDGIYFKAETYAYDYPGKPTTRWNVSYAKQLVAAGHTLRLQAIDRDNMRAIIERNAYDIPKLASPHIDITEPGIAAPIVHEGQIIYILIDGTHRCAKAYFAGEPFRAWLLTDDASRACHMEGPPELMPWGS